MSTRVRRIAMLVCLSVVPGLLVACSSKKKQVEKVVKGYVVAETAGAQPALRPYVVEADKKVIDKKAKKRKIPKKFKKLMEVAQKGLEGFVDVKVKSLDTKGKKGTVEAQIKAPNPKKVDDALKKEVMKAAKKKKGEKDDKVIEAMSKAAEKALKKADFERETTTRSFEIRKEKGKWLIYRNLAARKAITDLVRAGEDVAMKGKLDKARTKLKEARKKLEGKDFADAESKTRELEAMILSKEADKSIEAGEIDDGIAKLEEIEKLETEGGILGYGSKEAAEKRKKLAKLKKYREKVTVEGIEVETEYGTSVKGKVKNAGDKKLGDVKVQVDFLDSDGKSLHSKSTTAVIAVDDPKDALHPGKAEEFSVYPDEKKLGDGWSEKVDAKVTKLEFFEGK